MSAPPVEVIQIRAGYAAFLATAAAARPAFTPAFPNNTAFLGYANLMIGINNPGGDPVHTADDAVNAAWVQLNCVDQARAVGFGTMAVPGQCWVLNHGFVSFLASCHVQGTGVVDVEDCKDIFSMLKRINANCHVDVSPTAIVAGNADYTWLLSFVRDGRFRFGAKEFDAFKKLCEAGTVQYDHVYIALSNFDFWGWCIFRCFMSPSPLRAA